MGPAIVELAGVGGWLLCPPCQYLPVSRCFSRCSLWVGIDQQSAGKIRTCLADLQSWKGPGLWPARAPCRHGARPVRGMLQNLPRVGACFGALPQQFKGVRVLFSPGAAATSHVHEAGRQRRQLGPVGAPMRRDSFRKRICERTARCPSHRRQAVGGRRQAVAQTLTMPCGSSFPLPQCIRACRSTVRLEMKAIKRVVCAALVLAVLACRSRALQTTSSSCGVPMAPQFLPFPRCPPTNKTIEDAKRGEKVIAEEACCRAVVTTRGPSSRQPPPETLSAPAAAWRLAPILYMHPLEVTPVTLFIVIKRDERRAGGCRCCRFTAVFRDASACAHAFSPCRSTTCKRTQNGLLRPRFTTTT